jgi:asparagine synthase (glutamine-hydrolysing)
MCGIAGYLLRRPDGSAFLDGLREAKTKLANRGPDSSGLYMDPAVALGHTRLAIIDTSPGGNQPRTDETGRYTIVYNGEIYNYRALRNELQAEGVRFDSSSDSEVLLRLLMTRGVAALELVNGFFAFALYDGREGKLTLARDRMGIKPLYYCDRGDAFVFGSEMKALTAFPVDFRIDEVSLLQYLQLSYVPAPFTIFRDVQKLEPGRLLEVTAGRTEGSTWYEPPGRGEQTRPVESYAEAKQELRVLLDDAVRNRLVSDVPLGSFLSGGIDSTIVASLASRHVTGLKTFSIGFEGADFYDETRDAAEAARFLGTDHTVFRLGESDLYDVLYDVLDYIDEPFADSSALAVYVLSRHTRGQVTVALSGDGADELFGGYNKHYAEYRARRGGPAAGLVRVLAPLWNALPATRDSYLSNKVRQLRRFARAAGQGAGERYVDWCRFTPESEAAGLLGWARDRENTAPWTEYERRRTAMTGLVPDNGDLNDVFRADVGLVLPDDMLRKVDSMSMANSLEVRVPFLDHRVVEFCFSLPADFKVYRGIQKRILRDTFAPILPPRTLEKPKHGFEVPLLRWFRGGLRRLIEDDLLSDEFVSEQGVFEPDAVRRLKTRLFSGNPGDISPLVWALVVFQYWWKRYGS